MKPAFFAILSSLESAWQLWEACTLTGHEIGILIWAWRLSWHQLWQQQMQSIVWQLVNADCVRVDA